MAAEPITQFLTGDNLKKKSTNCPLQIIQLSQSVCCGNLDYFKQLLNLQEWMIYDPIKRKKHSNMKYLYASGE